MLCRAARVDGRAGIHARRGQASPHSPSGLVIADPRMQRDGHAEAREVHRLAGRRAADRLVMPERMDGRAATVRQALDVDHPVPGGAPKDRDAHQVAGATAAGAGMALPWSRAPPTASATTSETSITAVKA